MRREYDFSKAEKGKFYKKDAEFRIPVYLEPKLQRKMEKIADKKGKALSDVVNEVLKKDMALVEELT
ncbi:MAG: hypothetical protein ACYC9Y_09750 [Candidatus Methylomirabilia bacterium]